MVMLMMSAMLQDRVRYKAVRMAAGLAADEGDVCMAAGQAGSCWLRLLELETTTATLLPELVPEGNPLPTTGSCCWLEIPTATLLPEPVPGWDPLLATGSGCWGLWPRVLPSEMGRRRSWGN